MYRLLVQLLAYHVADGVGDGIDLCRRLTLADDEILADAAVNTRQVGNDDAVAFLFLDSFDDGFY